MRLSARLALLSGLLSIGLILCATEITLSLSERSRLADLREESEALARTWAAYLTRLAPRPSEEVLTQAMTSWPTQHITATDATIYLASGDSLYPAATSQNGRGPDPEPGDREALRRGTMMVWLSDDYLPVWRVAAPIGSPRPYGVLSVDVSTATLRQWARTERKRAYIIALVTGLMVAVGVGALATRWVGDPLNALGETMAQAREGVEGAPAAREVGAEEFRLIARRYNELREALAQRQRENEARSALLALEERARSFDRLALSEETASAFAHEIGTPLNTLSGHLQLLRDDLLRSGTSGTADRVRVVLEQVQRIAKIVRARLERGTWPPPALQRVPLLELAGRMLQFLEPTFNQAGVVSRVRVDPAIRDATALAAYCDPAMVQQILLNLLKNAAEAMPRGGQVMIILGNADGTAWIDVADSGPGLTPEARAHLFNPFASTKPAGTGLGLNVSRRLARTLGGDLAELPAERGTRWRLTLPVAAATEAVASV